MKTRYGFPSEFDLFYKQARPLHIHRDDREFVAPINWGQIEKDKQKLIDGAYKYLTEPKETRKYYDIGEKIKVGDEWIYLIKFFIILLAICGTIFSLDFFDLVDLGLNL
jgi:hypothetical protein